MRGDSEHRTNERREEKKSEQRENEKERAGREWSGGCMNKEGV
jgi:hypothetical protein